MTSCVDPDDSNIAFPVGTIICNRTSTTTVTTIETETSTDSSEQTVTTSEQILGTAVGGSIQTTGPTTMIGDVRTSTSVAAASTRACNVNLEELSSLFNLDDIRKRCSEFHACTVELYKSENLHRILAGENIQLRNICGLMYRNNNDSYRILEQQCSTQERESIKGFLEEELSTILNDPSKAEGSWGKLKTCLDNIPDNDEYINKLCRLKGNSTAPLCNARDVQSTTETLFNARLRENHCQCDAVTSKTTTSLPLSSLIGGACGGSLILLLIVIIIVLCVRHRKLRRRLETESKRSGNKTSPTDGSCPPNQGIHDHSQAPEARLMRDNPRHQPVGQAPRLPERYIPYQHPAPPSPSDSNYIELLPDVACIYRQQGLPGDRAPEMFSDQRSPQDRPYALAKHVAPSPATERRMRAEFPSGRYDRPLEGGTYFETIDMKSGVKNKPQGGNTPLGLKRGPPEVGKKSQPFTRQAAESENDGGRQCSNEPSYFEIEPTDTTRV